MARMISIAATISFQVLLTVKYVTSFSPTKSTTKSYRKLLNGDPRWNRRPIPPLVARNTPSGPKLTSRRVSIRRGIAARASRSSPRDREESTGKTRTSYPRVAEVAVADAVGVQRRRRRGKCDGSQVLISAFRCDARDSKRRKNG